jgi:tetratricopeptide (TPR) repeat protein
MVSRHSRAQLPCPLRLLLPPVLFFAMMLLLREPFVLRGQTEPQAGPGGARPEIPQSSRKSSAQSAESVKETGLATGESSSQAGHPPAAKSGPRLPANAPLPQQSALACLRRGDIAGAIQVYQQALRLNPNDSDLKLGLARALSLSGHNEESKAIYQELLTKAPDDADAQEGLGNAFLRSDHFPEARALFERLSARYPANPEFKIDLARVETRLGQYKQAREILSAVLIFNPRQREARLQLAYVKLYQGRYAAALADFAQLLKADPTNFEALLGNARAFYFRGNIAYSYALVSKLVAEHPNDFDAVFLLANLERARHHPQQALELLAQANQLSPRNPECLQLERTLRQEQAPAFHVSASYAREASAGNGSPDLVGFAGQDLRRFGYETAVDFSALPGTRSSVSFDAMPTSSPGVTGGATVPSQFIYRQTAPILPDLILRAGAGLMRFGPGGLGDIPGQSQPVSVAAYRPLGFVSASYALKKNLDLDLTVARDAVPYTPLSVRLGVMESRFEGGLKYSFAPHTELQADLFFAHYSSIPLQQLGLVNGTPSLAEGAPLREPAHGGSVTLVRNFLRFERSSLDLGYEGRMFGFTGSQQKDYMGFFNPTFYQVHQLTARVYGILRGPFGYDFSGGLGVQQVDTHQPFTQALNLNPALSFRINGRTSLKLGYMHYNYAQSLGVIRGNGVTLSTDSRF